MKKAMMALILTLLPWVGARAESSSTFTCSGSDFPSVVFQMEANSEPLPLAIVDDRLVSVNYFGSSSEEKLQILVETAGTVFSTEVQEGAASGPVKYVDGAFWVLCGPKQ